MQLTFYAERTKLLLWKTEFVYYVYLTANLGKQVKFSKDN